MFGGVHVCVDLLPDPWILEITTMCGHAIISPYLVKHLSKQIKVGRISTEEASVEMAKQCACGIFNIEIAIKILRGKIT